MFCAGDLAASVVMLASDEGEFYQPVDFWFPLPNFPTPCVGLHLGRRPLLVGRTGWDGPLGWLMVWI